MVVAAAAPQAPKPRKKKAALAAAPAAASVNGKRRIAANTAEDLQIPQSSTLHPPSSPPIGGGFDAGVTQAQTNSNEPLFSPQQLEMLSFRRFNPFAQFNAAGLSNALDSYMGGYLVPAARLWERLAKQQKTIRNVKAKREEAVALRPRVIERTDDSPMAYDQAFVLENFYANCRAGHALNRNVRGGFSKIAMQMMEAKSFGTAAHHLIWNPDSSRLIKLPSGKSVPSLTATFEYVPMEFFESRTGELRFLGMSQAYSGEPLEESAWLVTSEESPLMFAASVLAYYDKLATSDMINFSEKFGTPGIVVHTTAQRGTPEGDSAVALAKSLGSNYRGTQFGATENKVEIVWPSGGTSGTSLPMHQIMEEVRRDLASLFLGSDLSSQSRGGTEKSVGASLQQEGEERRERADCAWISETLNAGIDVTVLRWYFGEETPVLARVSIDAPKNEDRTILADLVATAVELGAQVPIEPVMKRLNVPVAKEGEKLVFTAPAVAIPSVPGGATIATNAASLFQKLAEIGVDRIKEAESNGLPLVTLLDLAVRDPRYTQPGRSGGPSILELAINAAADTPRQSSSPEAELEKFLGPLVQDYRTAFADDLRPLGVALDAVLANDTINFDSKVTWLRSQLPSLLTEINQSPKTADVLETIIRGAFDRGYTQAAEQRQPAP